MNTILTTVYTKGARRTSDVIETATEAHKQECLARLNAKKSKKGKSKSSCGY